MKRFRMKAVLRFAHVWRWAIASAWLTLAISESAIAGGGPENVCVVINSRSWASLAIANEYIHLRNIPAVNVVYLDAPEIDSIDVATFRTEILLPVLKTLESRGIATQIDCIAYSSDFPTAIDLKPDVEKIQLPRTATPVGSINGLTYLYRYVINSDPTYMRLDVNQYMRVPKSIATIGTLTVPNRRLLEDAARLMRQQDWAAGEARLLDLQKSLDAPHPAVEYNLACVQSQLDKLDEAVASLARAYEVGWSDIVATQSEPALAPLRERDDFKKILEAMKTPRIEVQPSIAFDAMKFWNLNPNATPGTGDKYLLSTMLAVTSGRGLSVSESIEALRRAAGADGTQPDGTVYFLVNGDVRSKTRQSAFHAAAAKLKSMGRRAEVVEGILPDHKADVIGAMVGIADFDWSKSGSEMLPGAICEHLTSLGGVMAERGGQTPLSEFIRHGAAGSSGAVTEPFALHAKFPFSFMHVHYASGCTLAESFYQSLQGPYQLLIVGDPLCRPYAKIPPVEIGGLSELNAPGDVANVSGKTSPEFQDSLASWQLYVDGRRRGRSPDPWTPIKWDTSRDAEGWHEVRLVAFDRGLVETQGRVIAEKVIEKHPRMFEIVAPAADSVRWEEPIRIRAKLEHARRITFFHNRRELGAIDGAEGTFEIAPAVLGPGPVRLEVVALVDEPELVRVTAPPVDIVVPFPTPLPGVEPPARLLPGLRVVAGDEKIDVLDTFPGDWFSQLGLADGTEFAIEGWFDSASVEPMQIQIRTNLSLTLEIDGRPFALNQRDGWSLTPFVAAPGKHRLTLRGKAAADSRLAVRFGDRGTTSLDDKRFSHAAD